MRIFFATILLFLLANTTLAQSDSTVVDEKKYIQLSGFTIDDETFEPIPYIVIYNKNLKKGTLSDAYGFFSLVVGSGDTILFKSVTFDQSKFIVPDSITKSSYTHFQGMVQTINELEETVITPYSTKEQLAYAMVYEDIPDDDLRRAQRNLDSDLLRQKSLTLTDAGLNYKWAMQQHINKAYYAGQLPPNNLLNPVAWVQFFKMLKDGGFKIQP